ncbi:hypothetical protein [Arenimonas oryziterrae]|uniref:hypothetical protein n=1 Tax=Arenimonas oryziterrae TaxID=498055 RepID=UPI0012DDC169|nr:hypothetical protein [Arenimonas oryziterrae]
MRKFLGRLFSNSKAHLLSVAAILQFPDDVQRQMRKANDEECESILLSQAEGRHGGPVDWRGTAEDVYAVVSPCLADAERALMPPLSGLPAQSPAQIVAALDAHLLQGPRALRALESFGDFVIVLLVPRQKLQEFDDSVGSWLA